MAKESKKEVVELTVEQKLKTLYQLQKTLTEIDKIRTLRGELPLEVQDLEDEIAGLHTRIDKIKAEIEDIRKAVAGKKNEIEKGQASIEKYKVQLDNVRNNREYDFLNKEIEFQTLELELCNKKIREFSEEQTTKEQEVASSQDALEEREKDVVEKKDELEEIVAETRQQEERLRDNVKELEMKIESRLLQSFKRIRKNSRNGLGIVYVQRDSCGGCFNKIPPQRQLDIRSRKKVIVCEYCGRILIDPELAEVQEVKEEVPVKKTRKRAASTKKKEA